ncbi:sensor histidine kinase [Streptomyces sp. 8N616]|uniref:sensor histidine kinase n=1 Tax=Streptomyces sp. 8N616 TaxID=3457414 RepID=UPI003FCF0F32
MTTTGATVANTEAGARGAPAGPWWWARRRSMVLDVLLAAASMAECAIEGIPFAREAQVPAAVGVVLGMAAGGTLILRRRWPIAVVLVSIAVTPAEMGFLLGIVGLYSLAASDVPRRITVVLAGMAMAGTLLITFINFHQDMGRSGYSPPFWVTLLVSVLMALGLTAPSLLLGLYVGARRRLVESLRERADGLERELSLLAERAEERAEWARNEERTRIAREMHDVVAHRVSLMVVHAAALQAVAQKDPERAARNAALVGDMGRQALTELREMLGVLRTAEGSATVGRSGPGASGPGGPGGSRGSVSRSGSGSAGGVRADGLAAQARLAEFAASGGPGGTGSAGSTGITGSGTTGDTRPAAASAHDAASAPNGGDPVDGAVEGPSLSELETLIGESRAAGMAVELSVEGEERSYARQVEQTAYRVVQEALTNVHKHAAGAKAQVRLAHRDAEVAVLVENGPAAEGVSSAGLPSGGNGLIGMRERVTALGGGFVSGPTEAGGFRVSAVLPDRTADTSGAA